MQHFQSWQEPERARIGSGTSHMEQTATGLLVIGWKLALVLVAGIPIVTTIGVFLLARFTSVFDAYAGERAKLLAQFHNLDKLVEQTKALTATTEAIKARTSDEVWDRQMRWTYKRDLYIKIIEKMAELISAESHFQLYEAAHKNSQVPLQHLKDTMFDLILLTEVAPIALSERAAKILWNLRKHTADELFQPEHLNSLKAHLELLRQEAQKELGYVGSVELSAETFDDSKNPNIQT